MHGLKGDNVGTVGVASAFFRSDVGKPSSVVLGRPPGNLSSPLTLRGTLYPLAIPSSPISLTHIYRQRVAVLVVGALSVSCKVRSLLCAFCQPSSGADISRALHTLPASPGHNAHEMESKLPSVFPPSFLESTSSGPPCQRWRGSDRGFSPWEPSTGPSRTSSGGPLCQAAGQKPFQELYF